MKKFLSHFFTPHHSNNFRPKVLHHNFLLVLIIAVLSSSFLFSYFSSNFPSVLGESIDITIDELVSVTNQKRQEQGLSTLTLDNKLSEAAANKALDMFASNYWAHNSPDGKTPWVFIKNAGYTYIYAGENLARGFSRSEDVVDAWMASPTHRENLLSQNYRNVGFAVRQGELNGEKTVLIVQMLGSTRLSPIAQDSGESQISISSSSTQGANNFVKAENEVKLTPIISSNILSSNIAKGILITFIFILILDMIIVEKNKIMRLMGHNADHVLFMSLILLITILIAGGAII